jgi:hypothetical protein
MTFALRTIGLASLLLLASCAPRGETKTLEEIYANSKSRYTAVQSAQVPADVTQPLGSIATHLEQIAGQHGADASRSAKEIAELLAPLTTRAGYTSRPAMGELVSQYRMMSQSEAAVENPTAKLLAARTYTLLASELETTKFSVQ